MACIRVDVAAVWYSDITEVKKMAWYEDAKLGIGCSNPPTRCPDCQPDGFCESCDSFEGRWIESICEYASTCDGCHELVHHDLQRTEGDSQLGYCANCRPDLFEEASE